MKVITFTLLTLCLISCERKIEPEPNFLPYKLYAQTWEWTYTVDYFSEQDTLRKKSDTTFRYTIKKEARVEASGISYLFLVNGQTVAIRHADRTISDGLGKTIVLSTNDDHASLDLNFSSFDEFNSSTLFVTGFPYPGIDGQLVKNYFKEVQ